MRKLEPGAREGILERPVVGPELVGDRAEFGVHLQRHVGRGHHRGDQNRRVPGGRGLVFITLVDRLPLLRSGGRAHQLVFVVEQQAEVVLAPLRGRVDPRPFDAAGDGMFADAAAFMTADPAEALRDKVAPCGRMPEQRCVAVAMRLAEGVPARSECDGFLRIHGHPLERGAHVAGRLERIGIAARAFGIDVDEPHLDRGERAFQLVHAVLGGNARLHALVDPLVFCAPINVALGLEHIGTAAAETEHRPAHILDRDIAGQDEQIGPADRRAVLGLDRPQQAACLVEIAIVGPAVERGEALLPAVGAAAAIGGAIRARRVPRHADEEGSVMAVIGRPPRLAVGHQGGKVLLERSVVEALERRGVIEILAVRIGSAVGIEDFGRQHLGPPVLVGAPEQRAHAAFVGERAAALDRTGLGVHDASLLRNGIVVADGRHGRMAVMRPID